MLERTSIEVSVNSRNKDEHYANVFLAKFGSGTMMNELVFGPITAKCFHYTNLIAFERKLQKLLSEFLLVL